MGTSPSTLSLFLAIPSCYLSCITFAALRPPSEECYVVGSDRADRSVKIVSNLELS
jgi:hypothetical protein